MTTPSQVIEESEKRETAIRRAIAELEEFQARYKRLLELAPVFIAIDTVKAKRPKTRKPLTGRLRADSCVLQ